MSEHKGRMRKLGMPLVYVLAIAALVFAFYNAAGDPDNESELDPQSLLVVAELLPEQAVPNEAAHADSIVRADGVARPARIIHLASPVAGLIQEVHPALELGGVVPSGEIAWQLQQEEYAARLEGARQELAQATAEALIEQGRARAASREWDALGLSEDLVSQEDQQLALRVPQAKSTDANVARLRSVVTLAEVDLDRCTTRLDFDLEVLSESIEAGAWVEQGQQLATGMRAGEWHIVALLTPRQADELQAADINGIRAAVTILGAERSPVRAAPVRWLPSDVANRQMRGLLLEATDVPGGALWDGARVHVELRTAGAARAQNDPLDPGHHEVDAVVSR